MTSSEIEERVLQHIDACDKTFDGWHSPGGGFIKGDKEFAYWSMRHLVLELLELLTGGDAGEA